MEQYISKTAVVAEIEKLTDKVCDRLSTEASACAIVLSEYIISSLDTLEVKEVDLEKYYHEFLQKEWFGNSHVRTISEMMAFTAKHFFELGIYSQLSWKDIRKIAEIGEDFMNNEESDNLNEEEYYTAILNKLKEEDYKTSRQEVRDLVHKGE
jgi:hypothetical protein